jgi:hypothetical protein
MNFSIILNTRKRPIYLDSAINSLIDNAKNPDEIDFSVRYDNDDLETKAYVDSCPFDDGASMRVKFWSGPRPTNLHKELNFLAKISFGKYIFVFNDDCVMKTKDWDEIAFSKLEDSFEDGVVYGQTFDTSADKPEGAEYSSFPIISRKAFEALGYFMKEEFVGLGGDSSIYRIYKEADRIVDLRDIVVDHFFHNTIEKVMAPDETAQQMRENSWRHSVDPFTVDISKDLEKLKSSLYN